MKHVMTHATLLLCAMFLTPGCSNNHKDTSEPEAKAANDPAESGAARPTARDGALQIKGSDSEVNLVQRVAEEFMKTHPDVEIAVTGGGSGAGIAALIEGTVDIANSSRELKPKEKLQASRNGVDPVATVFATDALSVIVHTDNPITQITLPQLSELFAGKTTTWDALGSTGDVSTYGRQSSSGTYGFFRDVVVKGDYGESLKEMNGNAQIVEAVRADKGGIGYVAVGYLRGGDAAAGIKAVPVVPEGGGDPVSPLDEAAVARGDYPIARPLYQYTNGQPGGVALDFLKYEISPDGQKLATAMGFYPIVETWNEKNAHIK